MIRIGICDDENFFQHNLREHIEKYMIQKKLSYEINLFSSGEEIILLNNDLLQYDIIFLDINMNELNGIETAKIIRKYNKSIFLVFITAHISHSLEGYKVNAIRYLLKDNHTFKESIIECLDTIIKEMSSLKVKINFNFIEGLKALHVEDIIFIESHLHKSEFYTVKNDSAKHTLRMKLDELEEKLTAHNFLRIHQSYLVNMKYITQITNYKAILSTNIELPIPKINYRNVKKQFISHKGEF